MAGWEMKIITAEAQRLLALAANNANLRADLRALAELIMAATESRPLSAPTQGIAPAEAPHAKETLRELTLGRSRPAFSEVELPPNATTEPAVSDADLPEIEARCRLKAEGARWAAARQRRIREGSDFEAELAPEDPEIVAWADRLADSFYWLNSPPSKPTDIALLDDVAGCLESVAESIALVLHDGIVSRSHLDRSLPVVAEAQSALRAAIQAIEAPDEPDQLRIFAWLKATAARHHVYIKRFMRTDDPSDPSRWPDLLDRIERIDAKLKKTTRRSPRQEALVSLIQSLLEHIRAGEETEQDWQQVIKTVDEMVGEGVPPSSRGIRDLLLPLIDDLPEQDDPPPGFRLVLRELDRFLATRTHAPAEAIVHEPTPEVKEARRLLSGRSVVLIGGVARRESQNVLKTSLGLKDLTWIETKEHQSIAGFEPAIARQEVALVLLAIRWTSHAFGDVKQFCDRYGKPLVRLPAGYSPNQVAAQILAQCSEQLEGA